MEKFPSSESQQNNQVESAEANQSLVREVAEQNKNIARLKNTLLILGGVVMGWIANENSGPNNSQLEELKNELAQLKNTVNATQSVEYGATLTNVPRYGHAESSQDGSINVGRGGIVNPPGYFTSASPRDNAPSSSGVIVGTDINNLEGTYPRPATAQDFKELNNSIDSTANRGNSVDGPFPRPATVEDLKELGNSIDSTIKGK